MKRKTKKNPKHWEWNTAISFIRFNINYSNASSWGQRPAESTQPFLAIYYWLTLNTLILTPCKLPFIETWYDSAGATKNLAIEKLTLIMFKRKSRNAFSCINCCLIIIFCHKYNAAMSSEKTHKPCHRATEVTVCVNVKPIQDSFTGFKPRAV